MKIGIITNHLFSIHAINYLLSKKMVVGFATTDLNPQLSFTLNEAAKQFNLPISIIKKQNLVKNMKAWLNKTNPDVVFVFAFPFKIPEQFFSIPKHGFVNFHPSLLPHYRGPDPVFWQIKNGENETGITAHTITAQFDSGAMLKTERLPIGANSTYGVVENNLGFTLERVTALVLEMYLKNEIVTEAQDESQASYFTKPNDNDITINWMNQNAEEIHNLVRACNPKFQGAVTYLRNAPIRILETSIGNIPLTDSPPGSITGINDENIQVATSDKKTIAIKIVYLQEGCFTGRTFADIFDIRHNDQFLHPSQFVGVYNTI